MTSSKSPLESNLIEELKQLADKKNTTIRGLSQGDAILANGILLILSKLGDSR